jgi:hypothetical protein
VIQEHPQDAVDPVLRGYPGVPGAPADVAGQDGLAAFLARRLDLLVEHVDPLEDHRIAPASSLDNGYYGE